MKPMAAAAKTGTVAAETETAGVASAAGVIL